jgi:chloramphenicol 3-O-phosphotransferase
MFVQRQKDFWLLYGIDHFLSGTFPAKFGHHGPCSREGIHAEPIRQADPEGPLRWVFGENGLRAFAAFHEWIAAASRTGCNIVVDHLLMLDPPLLQDLVQRLEGLPVLVVTLKPPFEVLERRIAKRQNTKRLPTEFLGEDAATKAVDRLNRLRSWFYDAVGASEVADIVLDTSVLAPHEICEAVEARLTAGPGEAFDRFRSAWGAQTGSRGARA